MYDYPSKERYTTGDLREIIRLLRSPGGCPWDREQSHASIRKNLIEECYEAVEAIDLGDKPLLAEELGDVLLQVYLHAQIAEDEKAFTLDDVTDGICKKLLTRHPHVFGGSATRRTRTEIDDGKGFVPASESAQVSTGEEALASWDSAKRKAKGQAPGSVPMLDVPKVLPALMRAQKVQGKARLAGMDFPDIAACLIKLREELSELEEALQSNPEAVPEELGDLLFSAVNAARFAKADAEEALSAATEKFIGRFVRLENELDRPMTEYTQVELDEIWERVKHQKSIIV